LIEYEYFGVYCVIKAGTILIEDELIQQPQVFDFKVSQFNK